jgi:hypothetical protein
MFATVSCNIYIIVFKLYIYTVDIFNYLYHVSTIFSEISEICELPRERIEPAAKPACRVRSTDFFVAAQ